jgi:AmiR/NasT family two-component response regulator
VSIPPHLDFRQLRMVVAHPRDHDGDLLIRHLQRLGCRVDYVWPPGTLLEGDVDVLLCLVDPAARALLDAATAQTGPAVIGIIDPRVAVALRLLHEATPHAVINRPFDPATLVPNLVVARNNLRYQRRQLSKVAKLEETLRSYRKVEQAKAILMEKRKIGEPEAYSFLREQAMRRRVPISVIASVVVESNEVLPGDKE